MKCPTCGTEIQSEQKYCPSCGTVQTTDQPWGTPAAPAENRDITKAEFCRNYAADKTRKNIRGAAILCYICTVVTAVVAILFAPLILIDAAIVLVLGLLIHLKQSRVCSVILLVYGVASFIITLLDSGRITGWLIVLAGVFAVIYTFRLEKEYQAFRTR
ncbi:MAG: zinc-ribbon domain-containing protein [Oscillospiraceae bacterium]